MIFQKKSFDASLCEELPYWEFFDSPKPHGVLSDGSLVTGLKCSLLDIECLDDDKVNQLTLRLRSILNSISENTSLQFCLSVGSDYSNVINRHIEAKSKMLHPLIESMASFREKKLEAAMNSKELYKPDLTIYLRTKMVSSKRLSFLKKQEDFSDATAKSYEETLEVLFQNVDILLSSFANLGFSGKLLRSKDLQANIYRFLNPKRSLVEPAPQIINRSGDDLDLEILEDASWLANHSPREQLVFGDLILEQSQFTLDSYYHRVITLKTLPEVTIAGQLSGFLRMPFHYDLILSFDVPPQAEEMNKLNQKRKMAHSLAMTSGNRVSDLESETKLSSTEELIRELLATGQRIYAAQMQIVLRAPRTAEGNKKLNREVREVLSRIRALQGAEGLEESVGAWKIFKGNLPMAPIALERPKKFKTNNLADFLPIYGSRLGDDDPVVIFRNRLNGLVSFNPFDSKLVNYNQLVTGSSGAGKSFLNNCILAQELARELRVFIIDIGGSYKKLTESLGGQYLEINLSDEYAINPFDIASISDGPTDQKLKTLIAAIENMVASDEKSRLAKIDQVLLEKAIIELYAEKKKSGEIPTLSNLMDKLANSSESSLVEISKILFMWTGSRPFGKLLDRQGSLRTDASICTFDLKGLSKHPDLQSVMILLLTDFIITQVELDKKNRKRIILDEAWQLLKSNSSADFMEYCARTLRKTGSGITFITQGVEEIVGSPIGSAIMNNTASKFILLQCGDSEILQNALKLNSQELNLVHSLEQRKGEYSEALMIEGDHRQVIRIYPSPFEYWLSTSDPEDNRYLNELRSSGLSLIQAIELATKTYPCGVAKDSQNQEIA